MGKRFLAFSTLFLIVCFPSFSQDLSLQAETTAINQLIPNQGFSITSLWRGVLGMIVLLLIAYVFSKNRKAINWKTVGIGLGIQLLLAVGVLKVSFIRQLF